MAVGDAHVFPDFLSPVLTQLFFPKPPTTFLTCFCRGGRRKYAGKKSRLNRGSNSEPPGHESDTLTTEPPGQGFITFNTVLRSPVAQSAAQMTRNRRRWLLVRSPAWQIFSPWTDDSHFDRIHSSLTAVHGFDGCNMEKDPVAWRDLYAAYL